MHSMNAVILPAWAVFIFGTGAFLDPTVGDYFHRLITATE
jgi:hypothetical protein